MPDTKVISESVHGGNSQEPMKEKDRVVRVIVKL